MRTPEDFTWIGPLSSDDTAGRVARGFVAGLVRAGSGVATLDSGDGSCPAACDLDGEVRVAATTVVRQGGLSSIRASEALVPLGQGIRDVAYVVVDVPELGAGEGSFLARCDEVWAPNTAQAELLAALGVPRAKLRVIVPGVGGAASDSSRATGKPRVLVVGGSPREIGGATCVGARASLGSRAFEAEVAAADSVVLLGDVDPWGLTALELVASGKLHLCIASGAPLEFTRVGDCAWLAPADVLVPERIETALADLVRELGTRREIAARAGARLGATQNVDAAARALRDRNTHPRRLEREPLTRVLADLGLTTPDERLANVRSRVEIVPVEHVDGPWVEALRVRIARARVDATLVVWVDEVLAPVLERVTARAEEALVASGRDPADVDVLVVVAPLAHAPSEDLVSLPRSIAETSPS